MLLEVLLTSRVCEREGLCWCSHWKWWSVNVSGDTPPCLLELLQQLVVSISIYTEHKHPGIMWIINSCTTTDQMNYSPARQMKAGSVSQKGIEISRLTQPTTLLAGGVVLSLLQTLDSLKISRYCDLSASAFNQYRKTTLINCTPSHFTTFCSYWVPREFNVLNS